MKSQKLVNTPREQGVVLLVVLVMLGILMVVVVTLVQTSNINFKIAGNQQYKLEAKITAQNAIETYISNAANFTLPLPTADTVVGLDLNGDDVDDMTATVIPPACLSTATLSLLDLDYGDPEDAPCFGSAKKQDSGIISDSSAATSGNSWCSEMLWNVRADVDDDITSAQITVNQGIFVRAIVGTNCPS